MANTNESSIFFPHPQSCSQPVLETTVRGCGKRWAVRRGRRKNISEESSLISVKKVPLLCGCENREHGFVVRIILWLITYHTSSVGPRSFLRDGLHSPHLTGGEAGSAAIVTGARRPGRSPAAAEPPAARPASRRGRRQRCASARRPGRRRAPLTAAPTPGVRQARAAGPGPSAQGGSLRRRPERPRLARHAPGSSRSAPARPRPAGRRRAVSAPWLR